MAFDIQFKLIYQGIRDVFRVRSLRQEDVPGIEDKYETLKSKRETLNKDYQDLTNEFFQFIRDKKVELSFYPAAQRTLETIEQEKNRDAMPPEFDKNILNTVLIQHHCALCGHDLTDDELGNVQRLLEKYKFSSQTSNILSYITSSLQNLVASVEKYPIDKQKMVDKLSRKKEEIKECEEELEETSRFLSRFSDKDQIRQWHEERKTHEDLKKKNSERRYAKQALLDDIVKEIQKEQADLGKEIEKEKDLESLKKELNFLHESVNIVKSIEAEMMSEVKDKMERSTMQYFSNLIWKKGVYDHIVLDDEYHLDLIHRDGYSCVGSCSAAERSLLALAFTLALQEVSGFNALLFIDTPVARVTGENRRNFANVLKEVSKNKQLIMTFTPDEYTTSISDVFDPIAATSIRLTMNVDNEITTVQR